MRRGAALAHLSPAPPIAPSQWARRLVGAGFESLWTPQVIGRGFLVPDPFAALAVAATATEGVELGTATLQVPLHHPADLAHRILPLVSVCGDRPALGVGPGSTDVDSTVTSCGTAQRVPTARAAHRRSGSRSGPLPRAARLG